MGLFIIPQIAIGLAVVWLQYNSAPEIVAVIRNIYTSYLTSTMSKQSMLLKVRFLSDLLEIHL